MSGDEGRKEGVRAERWLGLCASGFGGFRGSDLEAQLNLTPKRLVTGPASMSHPPQKPGGGWLLRAPIIYVPKPPFLADADRLSVPVG